MSLTQLSNLSFMDYYYYLQKINLSITLIPEPAEDVAADVMTFVNINKVLQHSEVLTEYCRNTVVQQYIPARDSTRKSNKGQVVCVAQLHLFNMPV